jgi:hypothetical protein
MFDYAMRFSSCHVERPLSSSNEEIQMTNDETNPNDEARTGALLAD